MVPICFFQYSTTSDEMNSSFATFEASCPNNEPIISYACSQSGYYNENVAFLGSSSSSSNYAIGPESVLCTYSNFDNLDMSISVDLICYNGDLDSDLFFQHSEVSKEMNDEFATFEASCPNNEPIISYACSQSGYYNENVAFLGSSSSSSNYAIGPESVLCTYSNFDNLDMSISVDLICYSGEEETDNQISTTIKIEDILYSSREGDISKIYLRFGSDFEYNDDGTLDYNDSKSYDGSACLSGDLCELPEGKKLLLGWYNGVYLSIEYISGDIVSLVYNGDGVGIGNTGLLSEGDYYKLIVNNNTGGDGNGTILPVNTTYCDNGCLYNENEKCYSYGFRKGEMYCSDETSNFMNQKESNELCDNSFECSSNLCVDNECIEAGFFARIMSWFRNLFSWKG